MAYGTQSFGFGPTIPGRFVNGPQDISPSEVPTNGSLCLFPSSDYQRIYARQMASNGTIMEVTFVPERPPQIPQVSSQLQENQELLQAISGINTRLDTMEKQIKSLNKRRNNHRKESKTDE